jgi:hypothetical protein
LEGNAGVADDARHRNMLGGVGRDGDVGIDVDNSISGTE